MEELISQLTSIVRGMWKFRWPALAVAWVVGIAAAVVVFRIPDRYEASARIFVDTQSILKPLMSGLAIQPNVDQQVAMLSRTLISRPNLEKLVRMADLDLKTSSKSQQDALIDSLASNLSIKSAGRDNLYSLAYVESDQEKAKRVIQSLVSIFVESSLGASRKDTDAAKVFLDEQIKTYEAKLEEAETRVKEFRLRNLDQQPADGKDATTRIAEASQKLEAAKLELSEAQNSMLALRNQGAAGGSGGLLGGAPAPAASGSDAEVPVSTPEIDARIDTVKRNLDQLLQRYTDQHPDVVNSRRLLKDLEAQKRKEVAELRKAALASPAGPQDSVATAAKEEMARMQATVEVQIGGLKARVAEYTNRLAQARALLKTAPQLEAEAAQLNRDYGIIKKNYEDLVARRQSATMSGELDMASGMVDFRLIDPPRVSPKPVSPNRLLLLPMALLVAIGAALFTAFALSQLRPVYHDASELRAKTGLPLLGVVSMIVGDEDRRRERMNNLRFYAGTGGLVASYLVALVTVSILAARQVG